jgi:hypothetical protein
VWRPSTAARLAAGVRCGALSWFVPPELADEVLAAARAGVSPAGRMRVLAPRTGLYFVLGLCLSSHLPYREALRGVAGRALSAAGCPDPASTALTALRRRLGERPFELLFARLAGALSPGREEWSHLRGLLLVAWDGTTLKLPASRENAAWAGRGGRGGHYPRARLVALAACGSRALIGAAIGPFSTGERALAASLTGLLRPGMLLLADRGFYSWGLWRAAAAGGADLLWRVQGGLHLPVVRELPDGSFLSRIEDPRAKDNRYRKNGRRRSRGSALPPDDGPLPSVTVRVIAFTVTVALDDGGARTEAYRMITTLLDARRHPAAGLAAAYARRWAVETCFAELKTRLRGPGRVLRSRDPALARQEIWAYLAVYQAVRAVIARAAAGAGADPARLSFTAALRAIRAAQAAGPREALAAAETAILAQTVPERPGRLYPRAVREGAAYRAGSAPEPVSQHAGYTITVTPPGPTTTTTAHQRRQPPAHPKPPP